MPRSGVLGNAPDMLMPDDTLFEPVNMFGEFPEAQALVDDWPLFAPAPPTTDAAVLGFVPTSADVLRAHFEAHGDVMLRVLAEHPELAAKLIWPDNVSMFVGLLLVDKSAASPASEVVAALARRGHTAFSAKSACQQLAFVEQLCRDCPFAIATMLTSNAELRGAFAQWQFDEFRELWLLDQAVFEPFRGDASGGGAFDNDASLQSTPSQTSSLSSYPTSPMGGSPEQPHPQQPYASALLEQVLSELTSLDPHVVAAGLERIAASVEPVDSASAAQLREALMVAMAMHQALNEIGCRALDRVFLLEQRNLPPHSASSFAASNYAPALAVSPMTSHAGASDALLQQPSFGRFLCYEEKPSTVTIHPKRNFRCHQIGQANATRPFTCYFKLLLDGCRWDHSCRIVHVNDSSRPLELVFNITNNPDVDVHLAVSLLVSPDGSPGSWQLSEGLKLHRPPALEPPEQQRVDVKVRRGPKRVPPWKVEASSVVDPRGSGREVSSCARFEMKFAIIASSFTQTSKEPRQFKVRWSLLEHPTVSFECDAFLTAQRMPSAKQIAAAASEAASMVADGGDDTGRKKTKIEVNAFGTGVYQQRVNGVTEDLRPYPKLISPVTHYAGEGSLPIAGHIMYQNVRRVEGGVVHLWDFAGRSMRAFFASSPLHQPLLNPSMEVSRVDSDNGCLFVTISPYSQPALFAVAVAYDQEPAIFNPKEEILFRYVDASWYRDAFTISATGFGSPSTSGQAGGSSYSGNPVPSPGSAFSFGPPGGTAAGSDSRQRSAIGGQQDVSALADRVSSVLSVAAPAAADGGPSGDQQRAPVSAAQLLAVRALQYERRLQQVAARCELRRLQRSGVFFGDVSQVPASRLPPPNVFRGIIRCNWTYRLPREQPESLRRLLNAPFGSEGFRALHYCVLVGLPDILEEMLWKGAEIDAADARGRTALHVAAEQADFDCADVLINYGASRSSRDHHGRTPSDALPTRFLPVWLLSFGREPTSVPSAPPAASAPAVAPAAAAAPPPVPGRPTRPLPPRPSSSTSQATPPPLPPRPAAAQPAALVPSAPSLRSSGPEAVVDEHQAALQLNLSDLEKVGYGPWSRQDAEANLMSSPPGTFLLRWSDNSRSYVLSYRDSATMQTVHLQGIYVDRKRVRVDSGDGSAETYGDMLEFIQHEQKAGNIAAPYPRYINRNAQLEQIRAGMEG